MLIFIPRLSSRYPHDSFTGFCDGVMSDGAGYDAIVCPSSFNVTGTKSSKLPFVLYIMARGSIRLVADEVEAVMVVAEEYADGVVGVSFVRQDNAIIDIVMISKFKPGFIYGKFHSLGQS